MLKTNMFLKGIFLRLFFVFGFISLSLFFTVQFSETVDAAAISWDGGAGDLEWESATNWSGDVVPGAADDVTIDVTGTIAINATTTINSLALGNVNSPVLNFDYDALTTGALIIDDGNLTVASNATITHTVASGSTVVGTVYINVQTGSAIVDGTIDVDAKGFLTDYGPGAGIGGNLGGGGGYGGEGGEGAGAAGGTYGSVTAPVDLGSGGGSYAGQRYSHGGGAVKLIVATTLTVAGDITSEGNSTSGWSAPGSGGSVYLDVGTFAGAGAVSVNGGSLSTNNVAQGGGGRAAIYFDTNSSSIIPTAYGGYYSGVASRTGGAGTVYMKDNAQSYGDLIIDNNAHDYTIHDRYFGKTPLETATYKTLTISNDGHLDLNSGVTLTYTTLNWTGGNITDDGGVLATVTSGDVVVPAGSYLYANTTKTGGNALTTLIVNGVLTHSNNVDVQTYVIDIETTGVMIVASGAEINVTSRGFLTTYGTGKGGDGNEPGGGGYGGGGGDGTTGAGGDTYGSITAPTDLGSAGGTYLSHYYSGGGGAIKLTVATILTVTGDIKADGYTSSSHSGPGSGGSVYLDVGTFVGAGAVSVNGGSSTAINTGQGGGGRIAIYFDTNSSSIAPTAYGGYYASSAYRTGGAGTVYMKDNAQSYGDLIIDNNTHDYTIHDRYFGKTPLETATYKTLTISNDGHLDLNSGVTLTYTTLNWTGGNITDDGGALATVTDGDVLVPTGSRLFANTARSINSLIVNGILTTSKNTTAELYKVNYAIATDATIVSGGSVELAGLGYISAQGPGAGVDAGSYASGAGHAGVGGNTSDGGDTGGPIYDLISSPDTIGSGGGYGGYIAPSGGGAIKLVVGGDLAIGGAVNVDAGTDGEWWDWGGASGGSVWFDVSGACSGSGNVTANGSSGQQAACGAGAGGYILMSCSTSTWSGSTSVIAGSVGYVAGPGVALVNMAPTIGSITASQGSAGDGDVTLSFVVDDSNNDDTVTVKVEYSDDGGSTWSDPTLSTVVGETTATYGDPSIDNAEVYQIGQSGAYLTTSSGANTISVVWESETDLGSSTDIADAKLRLTADDGTSTAPIEESANFALDSVSPTGLGTFVNTASEALSSTFTWDAASDTSFDHYEIWYGSILVDVQGRTGTALEWDNTDDANLANEATVTTTITGDPTGKYFKIWAVDEAGNEATVLNVFISPSGGSSSPVVYAPTDLMVEDYEDGGVKISWVDPVEGEANKIFVYRGVEPYPVSGTAFTSTDLNVEYFIDMDLEEGDIVTYQLKGVNGSTHSSFTDSVTFTVGSSDSSEGDLSESDSSESSSSGGSSGASSGWGDDTDEDIDEEETEEELVDDLDVEVPEEHWASGYFTNLVEKDGVVESAASTASFFELLEDMFRDPNEGMIRSEALELLLIFTDYTVVESVIDTFFDVDDGCSRGYLIEFAADNNLIHGYPNGTFEPKMVVNRAEALKMAVYLFGLDVEGDLRGEALLEEYGLDVNPFVDVNLEAWYAPYLMFAYSSGVVHGYDDGTHRFGPGNDVTYAEFLKIATLMADVDNAIELASELE